MNYKRLHYPNIRKIIINITCLIIIISLFSPINYVVAEVMSSSNYKLESDSVNFGGGRSSSATYGLEDTQGEVGSGEQYGTNYKLRAGYQQANIISGSAPVADNTYSSGGTGYSGYVDQNGSVINVIEFVAIPLEKSISLNWSYPMGAGIKSVKIVRSDKFYPVNIDDGEVIFEGSGNNAIDNDVVPGKTYYYALFTKNALGEYSSGVLAKATILISGEKVDKANADPFASVPNALKVDKKIASLTIADFDFIQDAQKIEHPLGIVPIDGQKNLTIRLDYHKVPEVLKTIAITLSDPEDNTKIFTFLLKVNKDKTAYEATIAPLKKSGNYKINIIILDYKNQGLKRLDGNLKAVAFEGLIGVIAKSKFGEQNHIYLWIAITLILLIILGNFKIRRKYKKAYEI